ncbi:MAG: hypothetical protein HY243_17400 [Proteobacteria bacterium]|nr:hypothetical protein [Pseudomonadota bacterium]
MVALAAAALLSACSTVSSIVGSDKPDNPIDVTTLCGKETPLEEADRAMLCSKLAAFNETALPESWPRKDATVYRVLMLSTTQPSFVIRIEPLKDGAKLAVRKMKAGKLTLDRTVDLNEAETEQFLSVVVKKAFWGMPVMADVSEMPTAEDASKPCADGIAFVVEGYTLGRYHFARAHCRPMKQLEEITTAAFDLAAAKVPELSQGIATSLD